MDQYSFEIEEVRKCKSQTTSAHAAQARPTKIAAARASRREVTAGGEARALSVPTKTLLTLPTLPRDLIRRTRNDESVSVVAFDCVPLSGRAILRIEEPVRALR